MKKFMCLAVVLGLVGVAPAAEHWRGAGWGGDGTSWNDLLNWDDAIPSATTWDANSIDKNGVPEQGTPSNHDIHVTANDTCGTGTIAHYAGYTVDFTIENGVTMTGGSGTGLNYNAAGRLTVKSVATYDIRSGQFGPNSGSLTVTIEAGGLLLCGTLRHNNGAMVDVHGELQAGTVSRISAEGTYRLAVHNGGVFHVNGGVPASGGWAEGGKVTQYIGSTVVLAGDQTGHYLDLVQAGEAGAWTVRYEEDYTYIILEYDPCNHVVFADVDEDGDVDQSDFALFQICTTGENGGVPADPVYCKCFDRRNNDNTPGKDGDIDSFDLGAFEACASAPGVTADPACDG